MGSNICETIREWFGNGDITSDLWQALICLISKQSNPEIVKQLRPIILCKTMYKLVTKVLVNRLKLLIPSKFPKIKMVSFKGGVRKLI